MRDQTPGQLISEDHNLDDDLIDYSVPAADARKGVAEELLIDLQFEESLEDHEIIAELIGGFLFSM